MARLFFSVKAKQDAYFALAGAYNTYKGVHFSIFLASIYVPVAIILSRHADEAVDKAVKKAAGGNNLRNIERFRTAHGLSLSMRDAVRAIIVIMAPLLTGAIGTLPDLLTK